MTAYETIKAAIKTVIIAADPLVPASNIYDYSPQPLDTSAQSRYDLFGVKTENGDEIRAYTFWKLNRPVDANQTQAGTGLMQEREIDETWQIIFQRTKLDPVNGGDAANSEYDFQNTIENLVDELWENSAMAALKTTNIRAVVSSTAVPLIGIDYMMKESGVHYAVIECGIHYNRYVSP